MPLGRLACLAVLALCVVPAAAAQVHTVEVTARAPEVRLSAERPARLTVDVVVEGPDLGDADTRTILLSVEGAPDDWTVQMEPSALRLAPGETGTSTLRVAAEADGTTRTRTLTVHARLEPLVGPLGSVEPGDTDQAEVRAVRQDTAVRQVTEALGPWLYVLFLGLAAALVLSLALAFRSRRPLLALGSLRSEVFLQRGQRAEVPLELRNLGSRAESARLEVAAAPASWRAFVADAALIVPPGGVSGSTLVLEAPAGAEPGAAERILVSARGQRARRVATAEVMAYVS